MAWPIRATARVAISSLLIFSLGGCALLAEYPITSASVGVWGTTGKGPTDHAVSYAFDEDCETLRALNSEPICKQVNLRSPEVVDKSFNIERPQEPLYREANPAIYFPSNHGPHQAASNFRKSKRQAKSSTKKKRSLKKSTNASIHGDSYQQS